MVNSIFRFLIVASFLWKVSFTQEIVEDDEGGGGAGEGKHQPRTSSVISHKDLHAVLELVALYGQNFTDHETTMFGNAYPISLISKDKQNRRFFPRKVGRDRPDGTYSFEQMPNCKSSSSSSPTTTAATVGCARKPSSMSLPAPEWVGKIIQTPPKCQTNKECTLGIPMGINQDINLSLEHNSHLESPFHDEEYDLPNSEGLTTESIVIADFDNDGHMDMIIGHSGSVLQLYRHSTTNNNGGGKLEYDVIHITQTGISVSSIAVGDFNNDSCMDFVVGTQTNYASNYLYMNQRVNGTGSSSHNCNMNFTKIDLPGENSEFNSVAVADFNNDGKLDIAIANRAGTIQLLFNEGDPMWTDFTEKYINPFGNGMSNPNTQSIAVADFDNNGCTDIVLGSYSNSESSLLILNNGEGNSCGRNFGKGVELPDSNETSTKAIALGDFNRDGNVDIVFGNYASSNQILINNGTGGFTVKDLPSVYVTNSISAGDINNDGTVDLLVGNYRKYNQILLNEGNGNFTQGAINLPDDTLSTKVVAMGDMNNDSLVDIVVGNYYSANQIILNQEEKKTYHDAINIVGGKLDTRTVAVGDFNGDNMPDIVVGNYQQSNQILLNEGDGSYQHAGDLQNGTASNTRSIVVSDLNGDGKLDIIIGNYGEANQVLRHNGESGKVNFAEYVLSSDDKNSNTTSLAVGDLDNDERIDILVGNENGPNQVLWGWKFNEQSRRSMEQAVTNITDLDDSASKKTKAIVLGDVNNDSFLDIIVGNFNDANQVYINNQNGSFTKLDLPLAAGNMTTSVSVADLDGVNGLDIVFGNDGEHNTILLNNGFGSFNRDAIILPGERKSTTSITIADINGDGKMDVVVGNDEQEIQIYFNEEFPFSEAMNISNKAKSSTILLVDINDDGLLDLVFGNADYPNQIIPFASECSNGGATLHSKSWCMKCPKYTTRYLQSSCLESMRDTVQVEMLLPNYVQNSCTEKITQDLSEPCRPLTERSLGNNECTPCRSGHYFDTKDCATPTSSRCIKCEPGTYAPDNISLVDTCLKCPDRLNTIASGSTNCSECDEGYYLESDVDASTLFNDASKHCIKCPDGGKCDKSTTVETIQIKRGFWRDSNKTATIYKCHNNSTACEGSENNNRSSHDQFIEEYCTANHTGALCESCTKKSQYFDMQGGECTDCPTARHVALVICGMIVVVTVVAWLFNFISKHKIAKLLHRLGRGIKIWSTKSKIFISTYQILRVFGDVYGVSFDENFAAWMNISELGSLNSLKTISNIGVCGGGMPITTQYTLQALWPFFVVLSAIVFIALYLVLVYGRQWEGRRRFEAITTQLKQKSLQCSIIVLYFALPLVAEQIFDAKMCRAFDTNDKENLTNSYLLMDKTTLCNLGDTTFYSLQIRFWIFFVIWILLVPMSLYMLLWYNVSSIRSGVITKLGDSCRFLWEGVNPSMWYWEILCISRMVFLTGIILFIDTQEGSNKLLRLVIGSIFSVLFFSIIAAFHPYKNDDDYHFALIANSILITCFTLGIVLKLCDSGQDGTSTCNTFISKYITSGSASLLVVLLAFSFLVTAIGLTIFSAMSEIKAPIIRLVSSRYVPSLELPEGYKHHIFASHVWITGQTQTHAIVRTLKLFLPGLNVWLDVDELTDTSALENSVKQSAVFMLFYSENYFKSENCCRELYAAMELGKPIVVVYVGDDSVVDAMRDECIKYCIGSGSNPDSLEILERIFEEDNASKSNQENISQHERSHGPIQWLHGGSFAAASLNRIYDTVLRNLPFYENSQKWELEEGIEVPNELRAVTFDFNLNLFVHRNNVGSLKLAQEVVEEYEKCSENAIKIFDVQFNSEHNSLVATKISNTPSTDVAEIFSAHSNITSGEDDGSGIDRSEVNCTQSIALSKSSEECDNLIEMHESLLTTKETNIPSNNIPERSPSHSDIGVREEVHSSVSSSDLIASFSKSSVVNAFEKSDVDVSSLSTCKTFMLLYLDKYTFADNQDRDQEELLAVLQTCMDDPDIGLILVHEQDSRKHGCEFGLFFQQSLPDDFIKNRYSAHYLFKDIAIPLYSNPVYRKVSLLEILKAMGGKPKIVVSNFFNGRVKSIKNKITATMEKAINSG